MRRELDDLNRRIGEAALVDGRVFFGSTDYGGRVAFRPALVNWRTRAKTSTWCPRSSASSARVSRRNPPASVLALAPDLPHHVGYERKEVVQLA